jgi:hypothetical protein
VCVCLCVCVEVEMFVSCQHIQNAIIREYR